MPWLAGFVWLRLIESRLQPGLPISSLRQVGYGFFLGYAMVQGCLLVSASLLGRVEFWPIFIGIAILAGLGLLLQRLFPGSSSTATSSSLPAKQDSLLFRCLFWFFIIGIGLHLFFCAVEVFHRPVYPWDAWTTWVYRAKAWFYDGNVYPLSTPQQWLNDPAAARYAINANTYPTLPSLIPLWAALSLGSWSDTLVNTPVIACGIALCLAIYGACRESGINRLGSIMAAYLFISVPFIGAHIALAGYADIWLAGFTGLGFIALISGLVQSNRVQLTLGLLLLVLGCGVKMEGLVWLVAAIILLVFYYIPNKKGLLGVIAALTVAALVLWQSGHTAVEMPSLGTIGVKAGKVYVPYLGSYQLHLFNVIPLYFDSFVRRGSWNILWTITLLSLVALPFLQDRRLRKALLGFFVLLVSTQLFIFGLTEKGEFAATGTAMNRVLLPFLPVVIFAVGLIIYRTLSSGRTPVGDNGARGLYSTKTNVILLVVPILAAALIVAIVAVQLAYKHFTATGAQNSSVPQLRSFPPTSLRPMLGGGQLVAQSLVVNEFINGMAIASSGKTYIDSALYPTLTYDVTANHAGSAMFFWRKASEPDDIYMIRLDPLGGSSLYLNDHPQWQGVVTEVGFSLSGFGGDSYTIQQLELRSAASARFAQIVTHDWITREEITQKFINWIEGGRSTQLLRLTTLLSGTLLLTFIAYMILVRFSQINKTQALSGLLAAMALSWITVDLLWMQNRIAQSIDTVKAVSGAETAGEWRQFETNYPLTLQTQKVRQHLNADSDRMIIVPQTSRKWFQAAKIKYHLLPLPSIAVESGVFAIPLSWRGNILVIKDNRAAPGDLANQLREHLEIAPNTLIDNDFILLLNFPESAEP